MLYFPWRDESERIGFQGTYASKFSDAYVKRIVHITETQSEPYAETVEEAVEFVQNNPHYDVFGDRFDAFAEQENAVTMQELSSLIGNMHEENDDNITIDDVLHLSQYPIFHAYK